MGVSIQIPTLSPSQVIVSQVCWKSVLNGRACMCACEDGGLDRVADEKTEGKSGKLDHSNKDASSLTCPWWVKTVVCYDRVCHDRVYYDTRLAH